LESERARALLEAERRRVEQLLDQSRADAAASRESADDQGDIADSAQPQTDEGLDDALVSTLRDRLAAIDRAEARLRDGTYGRSVRSGRPIPDERLEADPAAELTVDEAAEASG
jgi:DnaK suppressor protein